MRVFVTGATGFVGNEIVRQLLAAGHTPCCLVRAGAEQKLAGREKVEFCNGDATRPETLAGALGGCDAVIHLIGIIREFPDQGVTFNRLHVEATRHILAAAREQGVRRYLHMSSNGARPEGQTGYHRTKWEAEELVRASGLDWTIFRPSVIFGPGDGFINLLAKLVRKFPAVPVLGDGEYRLTPVAVADVAAGFVRALELPASIGQAYHCGGPETLSYNRILDAVGAALGRSGVTKLHQPVALARPMIALLEKNSSFPITSEQLTMLLEGNSCDPREWAATFGLTPTPLAEGIRTYLAP